MAELRSLLQEGSLFKSVAAQVFEVSWIKQSAVILVGIIYVT